MESNFILLGVNGTLMRDLPLNGNLLRVGASFVKETTTAPCYRLWSIADRYPGMIQVPEGGSSIALEVWSVPPVRVCDILLQEPPGLSVGKVLLHDGSTVLGVLAEPYICRNQREITSWGGWRSYMAELQTQKP